jgi:hypothetical protein
MLVILLHMANVHIPEMMKKNDESRTKVGGSKTTTHATTIKNHSTQDSRVVPHRGTNWAALWLTAQIGRDAVLSESYGRG